MDLTQPLVPLTKRHRTITIVLAIVCAVSRFAAMARSLWDWDEALFCLGMRTYDVASHHPHPPGFPVYIGMGRLARLVIHDDFRALQSVNLLAAMLLFPALFALAREVRLRFSTCAIAATLCAFFPNVWLFGGTAFSDIPSIVLVVAAAALLLRGCRDAEAYLIGTFLLALAIGIRPQNLLVGLAPGAIATWYRARANLRDVIFATLLGATIVGVAFGSAISATGLQPFRDAVRAHGDYITRVDSFRNPARPPLWRLIDRFFVKQYESPPLSVVTSLFVCISLVAAIRRRDRRIALVVATFAPFAIAAWLMLDRFSVSRFSIGYIPMFAILAADGIGRVARERVNIEVAIAALLTGAFIVWTWPALRPVRNEIAPNVAAVLAARQSLDVDRRDDLFVGGSMIPIVEYFAPEMHFTQVPDERSLPLSAGSYRPWLLAEVYYTSPQHGRIFHREHGHLWDIARRHYFDVGLLPVEQRAQFVYGWHDPVRERRQEWRDMDPRGIVILPPIDGKARLRIEGSSAVRQEVMITLNGRVVERVPDVALGEEWTVDAAPRHAANTLTIDAPHGLRIRSLSWGPD